MKIPDNYLPVMPYLILADAKGFQQFAAEVFGAEDQMIVPTEDGKIMHGELRLGPAVIMFAQAAPEWPEKTAGMFLYVNDVNAVYQKAMDRGSNSLMLPQQKDYGFTAGFDDPFGNQWWIVAG